MRIQGNWKRKKEEKKKRVETVTLSTTAKEKARLARKRAKASVGNGGVVLMETEESKTSTDGKAGDEEMKDIKDTSTAIDAMDVDTKKSDRDGMQEGATPASEDKKTGRRKRQPEPTSFRISNPARITMAQSLVCEFDATQRYRPIRPKEKPFGVIILTDSTPDKEEEDLGAVKAPSLEPEGETSPPEPFEWTPPAPGEAAVADTEGPTPMEEDKEDDKKEDSKDKTDGDDKEGEAAGGDEKKVEESG